MNKHTPGPWQVDHDGPSRPIILTGDGMLSISKYENGRWISYENEDADARLIAAAPELFVGYADAITELHYMNEHRGAFPLCEHEECKQAQALIAKVRGE